SIPILNQAGILQVSPSNTALQLTKNPGPAGKGAPGIYYPTGKRNYARVVPADHIQGAAQADWMKQLGVKKLYVLNDKQVYGAGVATTTAAAKDYPPAGQKFFKDFKAKYGGKEPQPYAIYGFEAMSLTLDAMNRAGANCNNRQDVINAVFNTKNRQSVLGTYSIDKDGDTTLNDFG